jgi:superfamily I DNA/RNA helicase
VVADNLERKGKWLWTAGDEGDKVTVYEAMDGDTKAYFVADMIEKSIRDNHKTDRGALSHQLPVPSD